MMKQVLGAIVVAGALSLPGAVAAQSVDVYVGPRVERDYYYYDEAPPRVRYYVRPEVEIAPSGRNGCGEYRYWNGERCADARDEPPAIR